MKQEGYIYILTNPMSPYLKIGITTRDEQTRKKELDKLRKTGTGVENDFVVAYAKHVENPQKVEQISHEKLKAYRGLV